MASRGLSVSKKQCCDILGWTSSEFDKAVRDGMPVAERPSGRGTDWIVFMGDVVRWIVEQELKAAGHEPSEVVKLDLNAERARLAKEQADKIQLENALARRELLPAAEVAKADEVIIAGLRDRVMAVQSVVPLLCDAAPKDGERAVWSILREALASAPEDVGSAELVVRCRQKIPYGKLARVADEVQRHAQLRLVCPSATKETHSSASA